LVLPGPIVLTETWYSMRLEDTTKEDLERLYKVNSVPKIAKIFDVSRVSVYRWFRELNILWVPEIERKYQQREKYFTPQLEKLIVGSLLGDGCIEINASGKAARFEENHSIKQEKYLVWKKEMFGVLVNQYTKGVASIGGKEYETCKFKSVSHPKFLEYEELFYENRVKMIRDRLEPYLNPFVLAIWYMDDGSFHPAKYGATTRIATDCFTYDEHIRLREMLKRKFDLCPSIGCDNRTGNYHFNFSQRNTRKLVRIVEPFIRPGFEYKIGLDLRSKGS